MDFTILAALALAGAATLAGERAESPAVVPPYITIEGTIRGQGSVRVVRAGKVVATINLRKARGHPELDYKLEPGDILQFPEAVW